MKQNAKPGASCTKIGKVSNDYKQRSELKLSTESSKKSKGKCCPVKVCLFETREMNYLSASRYANLKSCSRLTVRNGLAK